MDRKTYKRVHKSYVTHTKNVYFNNFDARTKVYSMMVAAEEVITLSRLNECWFDDRSCRYKMYEEE